MCTLLRRGIPKLSRGHKVYALLSTNPVLYSDEAYFILKKKEREKKNFGVTINSTFKYIYQQYSYSFTRRFDIFKWLRNKMHHIWFIFGCFTEFWGVNDKLTAQFYETW